MEYPPPPPDRMHLQHQPPPQQPPPHMGPGGAYGPMPSPAQPQAAFPQGGMGTGAAPERPATRPASATAAAVTALLLAAAGAWGAYAVVKSIQDELAWLAGSQWGDRTFTEILMRGQFLEVLAIHLGIYAFLLVCGLITAPLILKGKAGGRIFGLVWAIVAVLAAAFLVWSFIDNYATWNEYYNLPGQPNPFVQRGIRDGAVVVLSVLFLVLTTVPGVRAWTPGKPSNALIMMVPMGQQQPGPYGPQQPPYQQYPHQQ
ncbi:hypothetical protein [Glycomyces paridis]|uniref:Uncharacterized protein n=1 Tax=Glycomyces paridis TaxID=2126555 RepID=A0A4S8PKZ6_9ACTN|nr:hypothetical protein [Glycomyces paridis]THV31433.1 hypothetical protein E9998_03460 [Glycomyces paridis]